MSFDYIFKDNGYNQMRCINCKYVLDKKECVEDKNITPKFMRFRCPICGHNCVSNIITEKYKI